MPALSGAPLLGARWRLRAAPRPAVGQARCLERLCALVLGTRLSVTRPTSAAVRRTLGLSAADWSACYRLFSLSYS